MKNRIMIIEDNYYKYFITKQVLELKLRVGIEIIDVSTMQEAQDKIAELEPHTIIRPLGGISELLEAMQKRKVNRRNTEIYLMISSANAAAA